MKTFKEFVAESKELGMISLEEITLFQNSNRNDKLGTSVDKNEHTSFHKNEKIKHIERVDNHFIIHKKTPDGNSYQVTDDSGKVKVHLKTNNKGKSEQVTSISASKDNTFPAHKLYHHLITKHNKILMSSDFQSEGGKKVWEKLSKEKGVGVHGWDGKKAHNLGNHLSHKTEDETHYTGGDEEGSKEAYKMQLVGHKK